MQNVRCFLIAARGGSLEKVLELIKVHTVFNFSVDSENLPQLTKPQLQVEGLTDRKSA